MIGRWLERAARWLEELAGEKKPLVYEATEGGGKVPVSPASVGRRGR